MNEDNAERELARYVVMSVAFETEGWKEIVRELEDAHEQIKEALLYATELSDIYRLQGQATQIAILAALPQTVENALSALRGEGV